MGGMSFTSLARLTTLTHDYGKRSQINDISPVVHSKTIANELLKLTISDSMLRMASGMMCTQRMIDISLSLPLFQTERNVCVTKKALMQADSC